MVVFARKLYAATKAAAVPKYMVCLQCPHQHHYLSWLPSTVIIESLAKQKQDNAVTFLVPATLIKKKKGKANPACQVQCFSKQLDLCWRYREQQGYYVRAEK